MSKGKLVSSTGVQSEITFDQNILTESERLKSAAKWFAIFMGLAVAFVFVPILHFILVPAAVLAAIFVSTKAYSQKADLLNLNGACPNCGAMISIAKVRIKKVSGEICPQCRDYLKIHIEST